MNSIASRPVVSVEAEIQNIRQLLDQRRLEAALLAASDLIERVPEHRDALYLCAVAQRHVRQIDEALSTLQRLETLCPRYGRLYQERGFCFVAKRNADQAVAALLRAVNINPALPESWRMLEGLYRMSGDEANARLTAEHVATLEALPAEIVRATRLFHDGDLEPAEQIVRAYLLAQRRDIEGMVLLARIGMARGVFDDAETLLEAAMERAPDYRAARLDYARVLVERHKYRRACEQLDRLLELDPHDREYRVLYAAAQAGLGRHEEAVALYRGLLDETPDSPELNLSVAHALKTLGRTQEAVESYRAAASARPNYGEAYWSLANLKTYSFTEEEISRMRAGEAAPDIAGVDRWHLCFALGKALEDRGEYEQSYGFYARGNALKRADSRYRPEIMENNTRLQIEVCTREFFAARAACGVASAEPIFIVGLPRSGSTLIEQILASHSRVEGTQELAEVQRIVQELQGPDPDLDNPRYPGALRELDFAQYSRLGERYLGETAVYRGGKPHFIDKMPNNFRHLGLIHLMLPNARVIDARRGPMACCFGNLKQLFASGQEFTYSAEDIARYYRTYLELMEHWQTVLPGRILRVHHEDVVQDLEGSVRRILEFCGLPFERACIEFHKNARSVRTASSEQVRRPIYREGLEQWKRYEHWLEPLRAALGDALWRYRGTDRAAG
ncbi:MAG: sulfotransferase [Sciscionella sp.]